MLGEFRPGSMPSKKGGLQAVVVALFGDLDFGSRGDLRERMQALDDADVAVLDLSGVAYADSTFMNAIVELYKRLDRQKTAFAIRVVGAAPQLRRLFGISQIDSLFEYWDSLEEACKAGIVTNP